MATYGTFLNQWISRQENSSPRQTPKRTNPNIDSIAVTVEDLRKLIPIRDLAEEELTACALNKRSQVFPAGSSIFQENNSQDDVFYLLKGEIVIQVGEKIRKRIDSKSLHARFPLFSGRIQDFRVIAQSDTHMLRVPRGVLKTGNKNLQQTMTDMDQLLASDLPTELQSSALFQTFCTHFCENHLELPSLPAVATRLNQELKNNIGVAEAARIIQLDPAISAKLIKIANSPLYMTSNPSTSCLDAVNRFGLNGLQQMVMSLSLRQMFQSKSGRFRKLLEQTWTRSVHLSSLAYLLASECGCVNPEQALLAGLVCDIGALPFLNYAEGFPVELYDPLELDLALPLLKAPVGVSVLGQLGFPAELARIPATSEDWLNDDSSTVGVQDILIIAKLHQAMGNKQLSSLPLIHTIPAFAKFSNSGLSAERSLEILRTAKRHTDRISQLLV